MIWYMYCKMIITVRLINISITSYSYFFVYVCGDNFQDLLS